MRTLLVTVITVVVGLFSWLSFPPMTMIFAAGRETTRAGAQGRLAAALTLVTWAALALGRALFGLLQARRIGRLTSLLEGFIALAAGGSAFLTRTPFEPLSLVIALVCVLYGALGGSRPRGALTLRWRWLILGLIWPSVLVFTFGTLADSLTAGMIKVLLLHGMCPWFSPGVAVAMLLLRSTPR